MDSKLKITWKNEYSIGIKVVDEQHKKCAKLFNELVESYEGKEKIVEVFEKLVAYVAHHFKSEEEVQKIVGFGELEDHKKIHAKFVATALKIQEDIKKGKAMDEETLNVIKKWLDSHIIDEDKKIGECYKKNINSLKEKVEKLSFD